ncbi:hypothetical protein SLEP1_g30393 [Rubroshorea leprosula]|uniref:DUF4216 domain-containing protein n=1 Tax=Rubroshorea leprosula TaxID=152421 RepID=A0AAV5K634_9ROSI|nr:hypothetical protein SLEP1_g30393 [Rubroshorea leprosula]
MRRGIRVDVEHGIVDVNPSFQLSTGEPFCLASQAQQVYYTPYPGTDRITRGWFTACKIKSRHLIDTSSTSSSAEIDDIFQDDDPPIMQGSSLAIDLAAYQSLQLHAEGVTEVEVNADASEEDEGCREEKDSETSRNSSDSIDEEDDSLAKRRSSSSGFQGQRNRDQPQVFSSSGIAHDIEQTRCDPLIEDMDHLTSDHDTEGPSSSKGKKGRGRNLKGLCPPKNRESKTWVKLTDDKLQFVDPSIPRAITALWKSHNLHVRNAFINCMRHRWSDNMRDVRLKWVKDPSYVPCWMPPHLWSQLLHYWDSDEYKMLQAKGAKNRNSGERVTHTLGQLALASRRCGW